MPAFMSKVHAGGIYRRLLVFTGVYWNLPAFTDIAGFLLLFGIPCISTKLVYAIV